MATEGSSRSALSVRPADYADCRVVSVEGRVDHTNSDQFGQALQEAARDVRKGGGMVIDLAGLDLITSAGLRHLLLTQRSLKAADARLVVCGVRGVVGEVFRISRFETLLEVAPSTGDAVRKISPAAAEAWPD